MKKNIYNIIKCISVSLLSLVVSCNKLPDEELFDGPVAVEAIKYEAIDLGLPSGVKWATFNVGATRPWEYGTYYAWGEIEEKEDYSWETYSMCNGNDCTMHKYGIDVRYGTVDNKTILDPEDDVANVCWGGDWRMPTIAEFEELRDECKWNWTTMKGVNGYEVTGPNGNSIFFPAAGNRYGTDVSRRDVFGYYWSSSLYSEPCNNSCCLYFHDSTYEVGVGYRYEGRTVRPVCGAKLEQVHTVTVDCESGGLVVIGYENDVCATYSYGAVSTVVAKADDGYVFDGWFADGSETPASTEAVYTFIVNSDVTLVARFVPAVCEAVDLGLPSGIKWATCNIGASMPERYGSYYAWGDTVEKSHLYWESRQTRTGYDTVLTPENDVAHVKWGGDWRMPTKAEFEELQGKCTWHWTERNGIVGYEVTGPNENSIFLPAAGRWEGATVDRTGVFGYYWTATLDFYGRYQGYCLMFWDGYIAISEYDNYGYTVRPVYVEKYTVSVGSAGNGSVAIKDNDGTSAEIEAGATVTVVATPDEGCAFEGWFVDGNEEPVSTAAEYTFTVSEDVALTARFVNPYLPSGSINGYEYVDLGLPSGIKWATCNVGATKPEEYGGYYAWGETEEKENYSWSTYKWCNGSEYTMTKYCTDSNYGTVDNKTVLDIEDDVAHVKWGGSWRMPTAEELLELIDNCVWMWTTLNGVNGCRLTSKINGNTIFFPAAGDFYLGTEIYNVGLHGGYWTSTIRDDLNSSAYGLIFANTAFIKRDYSRFDGHCVRAVYE